MSLIVLEGIDRTGKSSVASFFEKRGFKVIHMSAPSKGQTADNFLQEMSDIILSAAHQDVLLDRSYWGEFAVWPQIFGRTSLLSSEDMEVLMELEETVGITRILMVDLNAEAHWQRCLANGEPLTKLQFIKARALYSTMADKYGFVRKTLKDFPEAEQLALDTSTKSKDPVEVLQDLTVQNTTASVTPNLRSSACDLSNDQKLEQANAIRNVLSKRILKSKGEAYDKLENLVRDFLNNELAKIFGNASRQQQQQHSFSPDEVDTLKLFCQRLKQKSIKD